MLSKPMLNHAMRIGIFAMVACLSSAGSLLAKDDDDDDRQQEQERPPQVLKQGFESTDQMLSDIERAERGPKYSAWLVESSRFLNVPHRAFQPDVGDPAFVDLPVNIGIIKAPNGDITLYDSGWEQLAYIFDWNTSCCWYGVRNQMKAVGRWIRIASSGSSSAMVTGTTPAS